MSGSCWKAWFDPHQCCPYVEWSGFPWQWVPRDKRRSDQDVFIDIQAMVKYRALEDFAAADKHRAALLADGAKVEIDQQGVIRVNY